MEFVMVARMERKKEEKQKNLIMIIMSTTLLHFISTLVRTHKDAE